MSKDKDFQSYPFSRMTFIDNLLEAERKYFKDESFRSIDYGFTGLTNKFQLAATQRRLKDYIGLRDRVYSGPTFGHLLSDNWVRFSFLAFMDRLITVRQSSLFTVSKQVPGNNTLSSTFSLIRQQGILGQFRGNILNFAQFLATYGQAYSLSNGCAPTFITSLLVLETLFYPLDSFKVRYQADTTGRYPNIIASMSAMKPGELYNGLPYKLIFSTIFGVYLTKSGSNHLTDQLWNLPLLLLAYPFLTLKTVSQVSLTSSNFASNFAGSIGLNAKFWSLDGLKILYRGFLPFAVLSLVAPMYMPCLWSKVRKDNVLEEYRTRDEPEKTSTYSRLPIV